MALLVFTGGVQAASLSLIYTGDIAVADDGAILATNGDLLTFDLIMDFSGPGEITLGGGFDIVWDTAGFEFVEYVSAGLGEASFGRDPEVQDGRLFSGAFGAFAGLTGPDLVATLTFRVMGPPGVYEINPTATDGIGGPFISALDFLTVLEPEYNGIRIVPIPAAVWLFGSGLLALVGMRRRAQVA
ncbi:MAG: VPLPA-CTERM sorting domain-containing protein [Pseudomonadota bacterium]